MRVSMKLGIVRFAEVNLTMPAQHMNEAERFVPVQILSDIINSSKAFPDPRGSKAVMYYSQIWVNGRVYNAEVLYDKTSKTIYHFKYTRDEIGNLPKILKSASDGIPL